MKKADYFSADFEIWWNIVCGVRHYRFPQILKESANPDKRTPAALVLIEEFNSKLENIVFLEP